MSGKVNIDAGYVAQLARLELDDETRARLQHDLEEILGYIEQLDELDVSGIEPTAHAAALSNVWREDVAGQPFARDVMLKNAPAVIDDELVKVPKVLPSEEM
ncbi:MAG: Asp-tRNA(Asn)/Glu-tRNA(Gln) amidotransferase subunit GatC [Victivallales bacterium]|jgi:aspartyl-tRNA(Asn)/glutamyl-tRNA(Gln) amidotransferase subunit C|nr:Asp-tRNA(Asn)/Glu-tRNA(Gln) amidotransferase subunit GatC [Victivallales bacterium]